MANTEPMLKPFLVSAPGKVIVFGEHAVVHRRPAIAAAVSLRSYLLVTPNSDSSGPITLDFPDVGFTHSWDRSSLPWTSFNSSQDELLHPTFPSKETHLAVLQPHIDSISPNTKSSIRKLQETAAQAFLYTLLGICNGTPIPSCNFAMRSAIPIGAGMGSSASISVCISTAALILSGMLDPQALLQADAVNSPLSIIRHWSLAGELCAHANPSGIDNAVATNGAAVRFLRAADGTSAFTTLLDFPPLDMLLIDTCQARSTKVEVQKVQVLLEKHPDLTGGILDAIEQVADEAIALFGRVERLGHQGLVHELGELIRINHGLLVALGVSHPRIERVRQLVDAVGLGWTKLTGAGGGGCTITLLDRSTAEGEPPVTQGGYDEKLKTLTAQLESEGFKEYTATLGAKGVAVLQADRVPALEDFLGFETADLELKTGGGRESDGWMYWP